MFKRSLLRQKLSVLFFALILQLTSLRCCRHCVQPTFTSLGIFREEHSVFPSSSSVIINAVTLTMGRVSAVESGDRIPVGSRFSAPV